MALGVIFVLLVCFLRRGIIGAFVDLARLSRGRQTADNEIRNPAVIPQQATTGIDQTRPIAPVPVAARSLSAATESAEPILQTQALSKRYGGLVANNNIDFTVRRGELRGIIGPNGAGKSTFFKMLTCEIQPSSGRIMFNGSDITGLGVTKVCQLGLTKSYQVNQLFSGLSVRENLTIAVVAELRGPFRFDMLRRIENVPGLDKRVEEVLALVNLSRRADVPVSGLAYGEKRRLEIGLALAASPSLLLLDEPLAGISPQERAETVQLLKSIRQGRTMVIIDHDIDAIFELAEQITVLNEGAVLVEGTPQEIKSNATVQEAYLGGVHEA